MRKTLLALSVLAFSVGTPALSAQALTRTSAGASAPHNIWYCMWEYDSEGPQWRCTWIEDGPTEPIEV